MQSAGEEASPVIAVTTMVRRRHMCLCLQRDSLPRRSEPHSEEPRSGEPGCGYLPNAEPSRRQRQQLHHLLRLRASRRRREARFAAECAARMMQQPPTPAEAAPAAAALADAHADSSAPSPAFATSAWYRAMAEGTEPPEQLSVRAGMQALAPACAAATAPLLPAIRSVAGLRSCRSGSWSLVLSCSPSLTMVCGKRVCVRCLPARQRFRATLCSLASVMGGTRRGLWREATTSSRAWISTRRLHRCVAYRTLRMIVAVAARYGLRLLQFDIKTAFLNGVLEEEVYVWLPAWFEYLAVGLGRVLRLWWAMYGLRQAPRAWNKCLEAELTTRGFFAVKCGPRALAALRREWGRHLHVLCR